MGLDGELGSMVSAFDGQAGLIGLRSCQMSWCVGWASSQRHQAETKKDLNQIPFFKLEIQMRGL